MRLRDTLICIAASIAGGLPLPRTDVCTAGLRWYGWCTAVEEAA